MLTESLNIYVIDNDGNKVTFPNVEGMQPAIVDVNLNRERMAGAPTNTSTLMYPVCLDSYWTKKEFIEIGSERYYVKQVPTSEKNTEDTRYKHEITFVSERDILENVFFFDCVTQDTSSQISDKPRTNTTDFSFYGDLNELVQRLNDSLSYSKIYDPKGENGFCIVIDDDVEIGEAKEVSMTDAYFATAMQEIYNVFEVPYYWVGKICHVGYQENEITEPFEYGSGNGLISVQKTNAEFRLINRITGQGSADNIPYYYPNTDPNGIPVTEYKNMQESDISGVVPTKIANLVGGIIGKRIYFGEIQKGNGTVLINEQKQYAQKETWQINKDDQDRGQDVVERDYSPGFEKYEIPFYANVGDKIDLTKAQFKYNVTIVSDYNVTCNPAPNKDSVSYWGNGVDADIFVIEPDNTDWRITSNDLTYKCTKNGLHKLTIHCNPIYDYINCHVDFPENKDVVPVEATFAFTLTGSIFLTTTEGNVVVCDNVIYPEKKIPFNVSNWGALRLLNISPAFDANKGIVVDEILQGYDYSSCSQFCILDIKKTNIMSKLMPSIYRQTEGAERFYNAENETYLDENGNYYSFNNPYVPSEPLEGKQDFEDIKPTINGITNENGELFGEIAAVAFDDTDSDDLSIEDASDANTNTAKPVHPYFYVKLHRFSGENGFNLFKQGLAQGAMTFNFITGSCAGCSFKVQVSEGKQVDNHYEFENLVQVDEQGNIVAGDSGDKINASNPIASQQDTMTNSVWIALEKDNSTFGVLMPNATNNYRPSAGDKFVITNILLPTQYITAAEKRLDAALVKYMSENNDEKFTFSIKFSRIYLQEHPEIAEKINENTKLHVKYNNVDYPLYVSSYTRKSDDNILDEISVELSEKLTIAQNKSKEQMDSILGNVNEQINSAIQNNNNNTSQGVSSNDINSLKALLSNKLSRVTNDTAAGLITFLQGLIAEGLITAKEGLVIGNFVAGFVGGMGGRIDKDGNAELKSLRLREFLEVPELRNNRIDVVSGELWNSICFGTIERVDEKKRIVWLKLQEGELSGIEAGDICRGVFHCLEGSNPTESKEDECGFLQLAGFATSYFTPTEVYNDGASFKYSLRQGTSVHPQMGMKFAVYGSFSNPARRASAYMTRTYTRYLNKVDTWQVRPDVHIYGQTGDIEGLTINSTVMHGYGAYLHNLYLSGVHVEFDRDWIDHNLPKTYNVVLSTYERTVVTDIEGNPLNGLEELRNVVSGEGNVVSGEENVIATRLALTTTVQATKNGKPMLFSDVMDEGKFLVELNCVGCTARCENGVVKVTSLDMDSVEHRVSISVNCEGEAVYVQEFNVPVVKQGENGVTADLDNEMASIAANDKGEPIIVPFEEILSNGRMWYGNEEMYLVKAEVEVPGGISVAVDDTVTDEEGQHNYLPIVDNKYCVLRITDVDKDAADINLIRVSLTGKIKAELNTEYSKVVVFKLNKVRMGENAQNYSLMVSTPQMQVDGKGNFTTAGVSCSVIGSDGKTLSELTAAELSNAKLTLKAQLYNGVSDYGTEQDYTYKSTLGNGSVIGGKTLSKDSVRLVFLLYWDGLLIDKEGVPIVKNGSSTVRIDLDNENDSMLYNDAGSKVSADCVTNVKVFDGSKDVTSLCTISIDKTEYVTASISGTKCTVSAVAATSGYVQIKALYPADGNTYYTIFSIKRLVGEDKYEIITSPTSVAYNPNTGALSHSYVVADVYRTDQTGTRTKCSGLLSNYAAGMLLQFSYDSSTWSSAISAGYSIPANSNYPNIYIRITDAKGTVRDYETVPLVVGGEDGEDGRGISSVSVKFNAGTDYRYNYCTWKSTSWTSNSPDVDYTYKYLWKQTKTKYTDATEKTDYECIGKIGDKGIDGNGTEWIYYLNNSETFDGNDPSAWAASQEDDYIKSGTGWTDDPTGVSATKRFEWIAKRSKTNGTWGKFTPPHIWAKYGEKGEQGEPGTPGEPGADATSYWLDIEVTHVGLSASGSWSPSLIGMYVRKKKGDEAVSNCYDFYVSAWGYDGSSYTLVKAGSKSSYFYFSTSDAGKYSAFVIVLSSNDPSSVGYSSLTIVDRETITITTEKAVGSVLVDRGVFSSGNTYSWKYDNDRKCWMRDMVLYKASDGNYYRYAIKSMGQEGVTSYPSSTSYWEQLSTYKTIITDCLYTDNATIGGFYVNASQFWSANNNLTLDGKNGNITISGKLKATDAEITGKITATSGTFDNCTIKDTCTITKIDAVKGTIGGFNITQYGITSSDGVVGIGSTGISLNKSGVYVALNVLNCMAPNETTLKDRAMFRIGTTSSYASDLVEITSDFMTVEVPIYFALPKYASAKSGQLCRGDDDNHVYIHP